MNLYLSADMKIIIIILIQKILDKTCKALEKMKSNILIFNNSLIEIINRKANAEAYICRKNVLFGIIQMWLALHNCVIAV